MKLTPVKKSILEEIENIGDREPLEWGDMFKPMTYTNFKAVASVSYTDAVESAARWRDEANKRVADRRKIALAAVEADDEDRFKHMTAKEEKFNKGEKITLSESLNEEVVRVSDEADKLLIKLALAGFHDWQQLALDLLDSMTDKQITEFVDDYNYDLVISDVQFEKDEPITEAVDDDEEKPVDEPSDGVDRYDADTIENYRPWGGAIRVWQALHDANKMEQFKYLITELYPDTIDAPTLNGLLWFDSDFVFESVGMIDTLEVDDTAEEAEVEEEEAE